MFSLLPESRAIKSTLFIMLCTTSQSIVAQTCPKQFYSVPLPTHASTCHQFNDTLPASMSFYSTFNIEELERFYRTSNLPFSSIQKHLGRYVLKANEDNIRIIISKDGNGSQVDLLVMN